METNEHKSKRSHREDEHRHKSHKRKKRDSERDESRKSKSKRRKEGSSRGLTVVDDDIDGDDLWVEKEAVTPTVDTVSRSYINLLFLMVEPRFRQLKV
jgi:hypothetical protein